MIKLSSGLGHGYVYCECRYTILGKQRLSAMENGGDTRALMVCSKFGRRAGRPAMTTRSAWGMTLICGHLQLNLEMEPPRGLHGFLDRSYYRFSQVAVDMVEIRCPNPQGVMPSSSKSTNHHHTNTTTTMYTYSIFMSRIFTCHKHWNETPFMLGYDTCIHSRHCHLCRLRLLCSVLGPRCDSATNTTLQLVSLQSCCGTTRLTKSNAPLTK